MAVEPGANIDGIAAVPRLGLRQAEVAASLGISVRLFRAAVAAGEAPRPSRRIGTIAVWGVGQLQEWLAGGGAANGGAP